MMKILFGLSRTPSKEIEEKILKKYSEVTDSTFEYKNEYSFDGILNELSKDKYDVLILREDIDGQIIPVSEMDKLTDKYHELNIIYVIDDNSEKETYIKKLFNIGLYNVIYREDFKLSNIVELIQKPRTKIEAKIYLDFDDMKSAEEENDIEDVSDQETISIISSLKQASLEEISDIFDTIYNSYTNKQLLYILALLNDEIREKLSKSCNENYNKINIQFKLLDRKYSEEDTTSNSKPKEIIKEKIKTKTITKVVTEYEYLDKKQIGVLNLSKYSGSTFLSINLARAIADLGIPVSVVEPPLEKPVVFDLIGIEQKLYQTRDDTIFPSLPHIINEFFETNTEGKANIEKVKELLLDDIYWIIPDPRRNDIYNWDSNKMLQLINSSKKASIDIIDIGNYFEHESIQGIIPHIDSFIVVIDPIPTAIIKGSEILKSLKELQDKNYEVHYVLNKWNRGINKRKLLNYINVKPLAYIPFADINEVYKTIYNCEIPLESSSIRNTLEEPLKKILDKIVPEELIKRHSNNKKKQKIDLFNFLTRREK